MKNIRYDLIVIGAGSAGLGSAIVMNEMGFRVLLIDKKPENIGGDCLNTGCIPSKALIQVSRWAHAGKRMAEFSKHEPQHLSFEQVKAYIKSKQHIIRKHENESYLRSLGIDMAFGSACFTAKDKVEVSGKVYRAKKIIIATGSHPLRLNIPGSELVTQITSDEIFDIEQLPKEMLLVGGGPIGLEIGQAFNRLGSHVTLVEAGAQILPQVPGEISKILHQQLEAEGMQIMVNSPISSFSDKQTAIIKKDGQQKQLHFDLLFTAIGRELNHSRLIPEKAGIKVNNGMIQLDKQLRTSNKSIWVLGDAAGALQFSHLAEIHVRNTLFNFFSPFKRIFQKRHFSWVLFTEPEVAVFGLQEEDLKMQGISYTVLESGFEDDDRAIVDETTNGKLKLFISKAFLPFREARILGGIMIGNMAGELIQELALAAFARLPISTIRKRVYPYPIASRINQKVFMDEYRKSFSPRIRKILRLLYR